MSAKKDSDPFLKSLATLREILTSPKEASPVALRQSPVRGPSSPAPVTAAATALRFEVEQERKQRNALEKALEALTDSRKTLQSQMDAAKEEAKRKDQAYAALQGEMEQLKVKHAAEIKQEQEKVRNAISEKKAAQESLDAAEARVASLELHLKELQGEAKKKEEELKIIKKNQHADRTTTQKNLDVLITDLKKVSHANGTAETQICFYDLTTFSYCYTVSPRRGPSWRSQKRSWTILLKKQKPEKRQSGKLKQRLPHPSKYKRSELWRKAAKTLHPKRSRHLPMTRFIAH